MRTIWIATAVALLVAGCGSEAGTTHPAPPLGAAVDPASPKALTERAAATLLTAMPVPPGARPATAGEDRQVTVASYSHSPNRVDRHATYVVHMSMDEVIAWYDAHRPAGTISSGSGESSDHDVTTSRSLSFDARRHRAAYDDLEADVIAQPFGDGDALLRLDAQADWLPDARPVRVPGGATSADVVQKTDDGVVHLATFRGRAMRRLAHLINRQHVAVPGTYNCPNDRGGSDLLTFHGPWPDHRYGVEAEGCGFIDVRVGRTKSDVSFFGGGLVDHLVTRLLSSRR